MSEVRAQAWFHGLTILITGWAVTLGACGCSQPRYPNAEGQWPGAIDLTGPGAPYTFESMALGPGNTDELFVCLTFSGGGTRAAALAYGVLEELRDTTLAPLPEGRPRSLLDEVDIISSVSGGSFTALAYKHWGKELFGGPFAERFLYHNVTNDLVVRIILQNLFILPVIFPDRIHIAADYVNERIFDHAVYAGLPRQRPYVVVNATSMAGERFEFTQEDFNLLGSDLDSVPLGHAAMASSAYPLLLSPMRLKYYANDLSARTLGRLLDDPETSSPDPRRSRWAAEIALGGGGDYLLDAEQHQFVYLLDGGVWDNLGLFPVIHSFRSGGIRRRLETTRERERIRHFVVIVVDAANEMPEGIEQRTVAPGLLEMARRSATIGVNSHSETTLQLARWLFEESPQRVAKHHRTCVQATGGCAGRPELEPPVEAGFEGHLIEIHLQNVADPQRRAEMLALPTSLHLHDEQVAALIEQGRLLLRNHSAFINLMNRLE